MKDCDEFCILIPTRNRRREVEIILTSIQSSTLKPTQIVIVSSGEHIGDIIQKFSNSLEITYIHSEIAGQINQKKLGLSALQARVKWVAFLDDDLLVIPETFENAFSCILEFERMSKKEIAGVGFGLQDTTRFNKRGRFSRILARLFGIKNQPAGTVLSNGHATSYLAQSNVTETQWLNGASMWRTGETRNYGSHGISSKYAACEDLIFSYQIGKFKPLIFCPSAKVDFQSTELTDFESPSVYLSALYWRYYFVLEHPEFSILRFNLAQLGRLLFALAQNRTGKIKFIFMTLPATVRVFMDSVVNRDARKFLKSI